MWLFHFIVLILSYAFTQTLSFECKETQETECCSANKMNHLECLLNKQVGHLKEILQLFQESQRQFVDANHYIKHRFDLQEKILGRLFEGNSSSITKTSTCPTLAPWNQTAVSVNPAARARSAGSITSCRKLRHTDQALLQLPDKSPPFWVLCVENHQRVGSGWLVIQQRINGKVSFFHSWMEYREGFGTLDGEFWLGLENIHRITTLHPHELLVEITDFDGNYKFARYSRFKIGSEDEQYALRQLGKYSGTAGDSLRAHVGMKFSTYDSDNDNLDGQNCAITYDSGWWFNRCFWLGANLNGKYTTYTTKHSISWWGFNSKFTGLKYTRMMLRTIN